jgi:hypothetical protein
LKPYTTVDDKHMNEPPKAAATPPKGERTVNNSGIGCVVVIVVLVVVGIVGSVLEPDSATRHSDAYGAGHQIGFVEGHMAYNGGSTKADTAQLDAAARRATADVPFKRPGDRDDWIRGFKDGYNDGWNRR